jgi:excinuclease ABC subunit A
MSEDFIQVRGAAEHNLKSVDLDIPKRKLVTFTGVSGSGKSSMAFDTLFAEGQRRYVESLSAYARQFLGQMDKPKYESIKGLSPTISIEQKTNSKNPRSTVGTITEIYDYLRVLYARIGEQRCAKCLRPVVAQSAQEIINEVLSLPVKSKYLILAPIIENRKGAHHDLIQELKIQGFMRVRCNGEVVVLDDQFSLNGKKRNHLEVVIDRLVAKPNQQARVSDSVETALKWGKGKLTVAIIEDKIYQDRLYSENRTCLHCKRSFPELSPQSFSFNSPLGMCPDCNGLGTAFEMDVEKLIPDMTLSLKGSAIKPWRNPRGNHSIKWALKVMQAVMKKHKISDETPFESLSKSDRDIILYGDPEELTIQFSNRRGKRKSFNSTWEGVLPLMLRRWKETESEETRKRYAHYLSDADCTKCKGHRLREESRSVWVGGLGLPQVNELSIAEAYQHFNQLELTKRQQHIASELLKEIVHRLRFLKNVGLNYLSLNRAGPTLSGGESQRIRLASQMGSELTGVLYILDEPSIGLHARDNQRLIETLCHLRDLGNSVLVVEHDMELLEVCDWIVDFGPYAGSRGGEVVVSGPPEVVAKDPHSLTAAYLSKRKQIPIPNKRQPGKEYLSVIQAKANNLQGVDVHFPLGLFTCVTGVSGAGKSTLIGQILYPAAAHKLNKAKVVTVPCKKITGFKKLDKCVNIDQSPIGRTPRSNPATYTKLWDEIRSVFAMLPESKAYGFKPGRFSFNISGGRCESCKGAGVSKVEMHFLADVYVQCEICEGKRFNEATLRVKFKDYSISDILNTSIEDALVLFDKIPKLKRILKTLHSVGLGYLHLGQSSTTLSGGEAQRIKLSRELAKRSTGKTLYILDEPSTGLHSEDICKLLEVIQRLTQSGNTVIMIEHNLEIIRTADWIIDLGPEGGDAGGQVVAAGSVADIIQVEASYTGQYLKRMLEQKS